jgi:hypothetical protein
VITDLYFFANGNVMALEEGVQVPREQDPAHVVVIREKLARGAVSGRTRVVLATGFDPTKNPTTVEDLIARFGSASGT